MSVSDCFGYKRGAPILKQGVYPYRNMIKCLSVIKKIKVISTINDRQNESRRETQLQNKIKTRREMAGKQQRNAKIDVCIKHVLVSFGLGSLSGKHCKPCLLSNLFHCVSLCFSLFLFWFFVYWLCFPAVSLLIFLNFSS